MTSDAPSITVTVWAWKCPYCEREKRATGVGDKPPAAFTKAINRHNCNGIRFLRACSKAGLSMKQVIELLKEAP